jgi:hypothetical protein
MKMATAMEDFSSWLSRTLEELNTDESVFGSYIQGILDSDETPEEKFEALQGILSEIIQNVSAPFPSEDGILIFLLFRKKR